MPPEPTSAAATRHDTQRALSFLLVPIALSTIFLRYADYRREALLPAPPWQTILSGQDFAPEQFRVGVPRLAQFLTRLPGHILRMQHALALIDLLALLMTLFALRSLLFRSATWREADTPSRWIGAGALVVLLQYALWWLPWYSRPETVVAAALLALSLWCSTCRIAGSTLLTSSALILLGVLQGLTRADLGVCLDLGIAVACLLPLQPHSFALPRFGQFAVSLLSAAAAAAGQLFIALRLYPQTSYGNNPAHFHAHPLFMLGYNLMRPGWWPPFFLFLAPTAWLGLQIARRSMDLRGSEAGLCLGVALFFCLWLLFGKIDEVRIFLPFALALAPLTAAAFMRSVRWSQDNPAADTVS